MAMGVATKEARTGKELPRSFAGLTLAAVGARTISFGFLKVHPYACAVYCDPAAVRGLKGASKEATATAFIGTTDAKKGLLLVFTRYVKGAEAGKAMLDRLTRVTDKAALDKFIGTFRNASFKDGSTMFFAFDGNSVTVDVPGITADPVVSAELVQTMLEGYLGSQAVDPQLAEQLHAFVSAASMDVARGS